MCAQSVTSQGRVFRPKDCQRLILYLKDINLSRPDKYDTIQLIAFLQQIVCYKGFYDDNLEFVFLERVQIAASMNPSTTIGRHRISTRFTANVRIAAMDPPQTEELIPVYTEYLRTMLSDSHFGGGGLAGSSKRLSTFMVELYSQMRQKFTVDDHRHYLFTPRDITAWIFGLMRYEIPEAQALVEVMVYEGQRIFKDRLVDKESKARMDNTLYTLLRSQLKFNEKISDIYFLSKMGSGIPQIIKGVPGLGRVGKQDLTAAID